jgi:hypothetical protein
MLESPLTFMRLGVPMADSSADPATIMIVVPAGSTTWLTPSHEMLTSARITAGYMSVRGPGRSPGFLAWAGPGDQVPGANSCLQRQPGCGRRVELDDRALGQVAVCRLGPLDTCDTSGPGPEPGAGDQAQVGATVYVIEIVPAAGTTYVPAPVPTVTPLTITAVIVPPVITTVTGNPFGFCTATVDAGMPGVARPRT